MWRRLCAAGVGNYTINGLQVCNLRPVAGAQPAGCQAVGGTCTPISADVIAVGGIESVLPEATAVRIVLAMPHIWALPTWASP